VTSSASGGDSNAATTRPATVPASVIALLADLAAAGYAADEAPPTARALLDALSGTVADAALPLDTYARLLADLPAEIAARISSELFFHLDAPVERVAVLYNPATAPVVGPTMQVIEQMAPALDLTVRAAPVRDDVERNLLPLIEAAHAGAFDRADMNEDVFATALQLNEAEAFLAVKPLYSSLVHGSSFFRYVCN